MIVLLSLAIAGLVLWTGLAIGGRPMLKLHDVPLASGQSLPGISIVIAARNEERKIEEALASLLHLDYPNLEFIVVNGRSTDGTGAVLAQMAECDRRLRVFTLNEIPPRWLGKNALDRGTAMSTGDPLGNYPLICCDCCTRQLPALAPRGSGGSGRGVAGRTDSNSWSGSSEWRVGSGEGESFLPNSVLPIRLQHSADSKNILTHQAPSCPSSWRATPRACSAAHQRGSVGWDRN